MRPLTGSTSRARSSALLTLSAVPLLAALLHNFFSVFPLHPRRQARAATVCEQPLTRGGLGPEKIAFIREVKRIADAFDVQFVYNYMIPHDETHLLPLFHIFPGRVLTICSSWSYDPAICSGARAAELGIPANYSISCDVDGFVPFPACWARHLGRFLSSGRRHVLVSTVIHQFPELLAPFESPQQLVVLPHGVDDDNTYFGGGGYENKTARQHEFPTLSLSTLGRSMTSCGNRLRSRLQAGLSTVLYVGTRPGVGLEGAFLSHAFQGPAQALVREALRRLAEDHNVIIRPHPSDLDLVTGRQGYADDFPDCIIDDYLDRNEFEATVGLADVIISEASSAGTLAVYFGVDKPFVYMVPEVERFRQVRDCTINERMAEIFFPALAQTPSELLQAVARAKANTGASQADARRAYLRSHLGDIDGNEEFRVVAKIFRDLAHGSPAMAQEVEGLQRILAKFSNISELGGVMIPTCGVFS